MRFDDPLWIASQIFAILALIVIVYTIIWTKIKSKTLICIMLFNVLVSISNALLSNYLLMGISILAVFRDGVFLWRERYYRDDNTLAIYILVFFLIASIVLAIFTIKWNAAPNLLLLSILIQISSLFVIYGAWASGVHLIRISRLTISILNIINQLIFANYTIVLIEVFSISATAIFYIQYYRKLKTIQTQS
jgi:hypothetical protein